MLTSLLTKSVPFTFNRAGYYYFSRRVPADLVQHYSHPRIVQGLKTRSAQTAKSRASVAAAKLDEYWSYLGYVKDRWQSVFGFAAAVCNVACTI